MYKEVTYKISIDLCYQVFFLLSSFIFDRRCKICDTEWWRIKYIYRRCFCVTGISSSYACSSTSNGSISKSNGKTGIRRKKTYTMLNKVGLLSFRNILYSYESSWSLYYEDHILGLYYLGMQKYHWWQNLRFLRSISLSFLEQK